MCQEGNHDGCIDYFRFEPYCPCGCALAVPGLLPDFDGETYDHDLDWFRLGDQLHRTADVMRDRKWRTLEEIQYVTGDMTQSISARLRDLRKVKFGRHSVLRRRRGEPKAGLWEYRVLLRVKR